MRKKKNFVVMFSAISVLALVLSGFIVYRMFVWKETQIKLSVTYNELFTPQQLKEKGHNSLIPEYLTDVSIGYENEDGTKSLYVYASPIRYLNSSGQLSLIDTRIANVRDEKMRHQEYVYTIANSDVKPFCPKQLTQQKGVRLEKDIACEIGIYNDKPAWGWYEKQDNFINQEKNMIVYKNMLGKDNHISFYPSSLGTNCEIQFNRTLKEDALQFWIHITEESVTVKKEPGGYLTLNQIKTDETGKTVNEIVGVIQKPLLKDPQGNVSENNQIELFSEGNGRYKLLFHLDDAISLKGAKVFIAFEMRREKQPDNALYSNFPNLEYAYLRNYSVIGNSETYGKGRLMIRYKFAKFFNLQSSQIKEANYYTYTLTQNNAEFELLSVLEDWCSLTGNWSKNYKTGNRTSFLKQTGFELKFNITEEVKKWCDDPDGQMEHNGVMLKFITEKEGGYSVILSNDNTLFRNVTEVILK